MLESVTDLFHGISLFSDAKYFGGPAIFKPVETRFESSVTNPACRPFKARSSVLGNWNGVGRLPVADPPRTTDPSRLSRNEFLVFGASPAYESMFLNKSVIMQDSSASTTKKLYWQRSSR